MKNIVNHKSKRGDITLLVTLLVCFTVLILLTPISQKVVLESRISKENLMSQQAVQAAKTGLDAWKYKVNEDLDLNLNNSNINTTNLDNSLGIKYEVTYNKQVGSTPAYLVSRGEVTRNGVTIERVLEEEFTPL